MSFPKTQSNRYLNFYFQVHQPNRLRHFRFLDIGSGASYFDEELDEKIIRRVADRCYLPTNKLLLNLIRKYPQIKITFSISGTSLEQFEKYTPEVIESFRLLASTGSVEFLSETYYHSLSFLMGHDEFISQVGLHQNKIYKLFGVFPTVFRNTELIYSDAIGRLIESVGFKGIYIDGIEQILKGQSPHALYHHPAKHGLKLFLRDYTLSDDIAFRFSDKSLKDYPLTTQKYIHRIETAKEEMPLINIALDYETFGEHQDKSTGIFKFLKSTLTAIAKSKHLIMLTPSEAIEKLKGQGPLSAPGYISWADTERDLSAWLGNNMQQDAFANLKKLERSLKKINDPELIDIWRLLQTSDHFYYMSTKSNSDGGVHAYFSPYSSPYEAFMNYMNVLTDFSLKVSKGNKERTNQKRKAKAIG